MVQKSETRAGKARASRNSCAGCFRAYLNPYSLQSQFPRAGHLIRPEMAQLIVAPMSEGIPS
jgi:hypothetical protein